MTQSPVARPISPGTAIPASGVRRTILAPSDVHVEAVHCRRLHRQGWRVLSDELEGLADPFLACAEAWRPLAERADDSIVRLGERDSGLVRFGSRRGGA